MSVQLATILVSKCEENRGEYKMPVGLYSPQFHSLQETKMVAHVRSHEKIRDWNQSKSSSLLFCIDEQ